MMLTEPTSMSKLFELILLSLCVVLAVLGTVASIRGVMHRNFFHPGPSTNTATKAMEMMLLAGLCGGTIIGIVLALIAR